MALTVTQPKRVFVYQDSNDDEVKLPDPNPDMTLGQVKKFYAAQYPEIITSVFTGPVIKKEKNSDIQVATYSIKTTPGEKG